jgi:hypothetical protein
MLLTACTYILGLEIHKITKKELKVMQQRVNKTLKVKQNIFLKHGKGLVHLLLLSMTVVSLSAGTNICTIENDERFQVIGHWKV